MIQKRFLNFHASFFNEKCPNTAKCPITPQFYTTYAYQNPRKSYPVLPSTSEVNESDIHILNKRFEKKNKLKKKLLQILKHLFDIVSLVRN